MVARRLTATGRSVFAFLSILRTVNRRANGRSRNKVAVVRWKLDFYLISHIPDSGVTSHEHDADIVPRAT